MTAALHLAGVHRALRGAPVLAGLDLEVGQGEVRALVGLNGAGKTTALRVALGMLRPDRGTVRIAGRDVGGPDRTLWRGVGHLVETPLAYPELTARENIHAAARLHGLGTAAAAAAVEVVAEPLGLARWLDVAVRRLSLGTRQKVGIAAALAHSPALVVLDEPTNALDPLAVVGLRELLRAHAAGGGAALVTSHHFDELARLARSVDVLHRGRVVASLPSDGGDLERRFFDLVLAADAQAVAA